MSGQNLIDILQSIAIILLTIGNIRAKEVRNACNS